MKLSTRIAAFFQPLIVLLSSFVELYRNIRMWYFPRKRPANTNVLPEKTQASIRKHYSRAFCAGRGLRLRVDCGDYVRKLPMPANPSGADIIVDDAEYFAHVKRDERHDGRVSGIRPKHA